MIREIWEHFAHPTITIAGGGNGAVPADSSLDSPFDQVDVFIGSQYQSSYDGTISWQSYPDGIPHTELLVVAMQNGQPRAIRYSWAKPVMNIEVRGILTNHNGANAIRATLHLNTMKLVRVR